MKASLLFLLLSCSCSMIMSNTYEPLVDLGEQHPNIRIDMRYASSRNCTGKQIMRNPRCLVLPEMAQALCNIQNELEKHGLCLLIWNAYEPPSLRNILQQLFDGTGVNINNDGHENGSAVDLTLVLKNGDPVPMPSDFDCVTAESQRSYQHFPDYIKQNLKAFEAIMTKHGFTVGKEWWHYRFILRDNAPALDIEI